MQKRRKEDKLPYQEWTLTKHLHNAWEIHVQCDCHRRLKTHFSHLPKGCTSATSICALAELYNMLRQKQKKDSWDHSKSKHKHHKLSIKKNKKELCLSECTVYKVLATTYRSAWEEKPALSESKTLATCHLKKYALLQNRVKYRRL